MKAAIKLGRDDIATSYLGELQSSQKNLEATKLQMQQAKLASEKAIKFRDNYLLQMKRKSDRAITHCRQQAGAHAGAAGPDHDQLPGR